MEAEDKVDGCFYRKAQDYWSTVPATVNGMLGGLGFLNSTDIANSNRFLDDLKGLEWDCALDCGAGIGRVSKNLLMPRFKVVDLVEQDKAFANKARDYLTTENTTQAIYSTRLGEVFNVGLQTFSPTEAKYNLIWSQWVLGHLTDEDLLRFFVRIRTGLSKAGYFVMKENVTSSGKIEIDDTDSSLARPLDRYTAILKRAGFRIAKMKKEPNFPTGLYPVYTIACIPADI